MTPAARVQAAIEILDQIITSAIVDGPAADVIVARNLKERRYAGAKDRRAVREMVFETIRTVGERPASGRAAIYALGYTRRLFDGSPYGPAPIGPNEGTARTQLLPDWIQTELSPLVGKDEWPPLLERAPVDLRVNAARAARDELLMQFPDAEPTRLSPWGIRLPADSRVDDHPAFRTGLVEIQDEGSQLIALACEPANGQRILDLCAGAGGKSLALAAVATGAQIFATDSNRDRLAKLAPRAARAGVSIETLMLNPPNEARQVADWAGPVDTVLVDAPCSGSGTWRRNPEGRWRLTPQRLARLVALQSRLLDIAATAVRPGGKLVYAVCSLLKQEGAGQIDSFLERHSSWVADETPIAAGRLDGHGVLMTPGHDGTDGFFVARLTRPCYGTEQTRS